MPKGRNDVTEEEVKRSYFYNEEDKDYDCTIIIGYENGCLHNSSLLLLRFNKYQPYFSKKKRKHQQNYYTMYTNYLKMME